jgi:hypothetical protein
MNKSKYTPRSAAADEVGIVNKLNYQLGYLIAINPSSG